MCARADIVFVVDTSDSILERYSLAPSGSHLQKVIDTVNAVITKISQSGRSINFGLVHFDDKSHVGFHLNTYQDSSIRDIMDAVSRITSGGMNADFAEAFETARLDVFGKDGDRDDATNLIIFISDGDINFR